MLTQTITKEPIELQSLLHQSAKLHKHLCPRQVLGVRMGMLAGDILGLDLPQTGKRLFTFMETDGCAADGVSVATGCWVGRRTMRMVDFGKVAATFVDTRTGETYRVWPSSKSRQLAAEWATEARSRWHGQLEAYQFLPADALLRVQRVTLSVDLQAILSRPGVRETCSQCREEIINQREVYLAGETYCRACAGDRYYATLNTPIHQMRSRDKVLTSLNQA